ncbi:DUF5452 domain-containing protein [Ureaplasma zalophigenitalium]|uniref:Uncharacterized protein n=1 Tax=Ureaplasma zalophigenitalium TaxID=907723 RepID=A0ABT3BP04_9BACT|nr:DUF5452 domain-containing protein [Ureaplasma zalophigenitalium]MCV3753913.1 hypothetical protein [Ureaplasma zalophigenitalium]
MTVLNKFKQFFKTPRTKVILFTCLGLAIIGAAVGIGISLGVKNQKNNIDTSLPTDKQILQPIQKTQDQINSAFTINNNKELLGKDNKIQPIKKEVVIVDHHKSANIHVRETKPSNTSTDLQEHIDQNHTQKHQDKTENALKQKNEAINSSEILNETTHNFEVTDLNHNPHEDKNKVNNSLKPLDEMNTNLEQVDKNTNTSKHQDNNADLQIEVDSTVHSPEDTGQSVDSQKQINTSTNKQSHSDQKLSIEEKEQENKGLHDKNVKQNKPHKHNNQETINNQDVPNSNPNNKQIKKEDAPDLIEVEQIQLTRFNLKPVLEKMNDFYELIDFRKYFNEPGNKINFEETAIKEQLKNIFLKAILTFDQFKRVWNYLEYSVKYKIIDKRLIVLVNWQINTPDVGIKKQFYDQLSFYLEQ